MLQSSSKPVIIREFQNFSQPKSHEKNKSLIVVFDSSQPVGNLSQIVKPSVIALGKCSRLFMKLFGSLFLIDCQSICGLCEHNHLDKPDTTKGLSMGSEEIQSP